MQIFETVATVDDHGQVHMTGVPFPPGTAVEVTIRHVARGAHPPAANAGLRWEGNVLVHQGAGADPSVSELRDERLNRLAERTSG